ncbi:hypothetical protein KAFR_0E03990 [Kazachstania africana CBS 2517]|uniref:VHS domain-containing protein n=1 Tax=Kazachstania africana (strain ATCC 22294 / BCRC 22015 / CBS 2517 / CECT 1963 / NBRC 1671 / NRRL Y-8276) TaxID=1071382 RepID=H2AW00_KAZAF|nr:hypothetical protein KAFR_0E03990 [Kazachstania africana CBS 2517]CCF58550.1 hypothetical protein KAFR_0E03990 [Kazachstania africana CBS 2517]
MSSYGIYLEDGPVRRPQPVGNPLLRKINRACRMSLPEPDLALNLDIADYINEKQGGAAYDASKAIVKLINNRDTHTAVFALALLDVLVKNCGYPLHLQISRKAFLNELVKRFPEHPPLRYSKVQRLILTAIEEWYQTICKLSEYKDEMNYIRDMRRLLKYKGYIFPKIQSDNLAVMRPTDQLKTPSEIQKEQEIVQAAKLEELIRSGRPDDLKEANKLMKVMAGFKEDNIVKAKQSVNNELNKLKRKADLLNEMLSSSDDMNDNETAEELYAALKNAQPKFQKIIEEEHDDDDLVQDLLKFNDNVNQLLEKYSLLRNGNVTAAQQINPQAMSTGSMMQSNSGALANEINLIDFGDDLGVTSPSPTPNASSTTNTGDVIDLLGDLTLSSSPSSPKNDTNNNSLSLAGGIKLDDNNDSLDLFGDFTSTGTSSRILINQSATLKIEAENKRLSDSTVNSKIYFSNLSNDKLTDLTFLIAVPKSMKLTLLPQSDNEMVPHTNSGISQEANIDNVPKAAGKPLKIKWKVNYKIANNPIEETAVFTFPAL